MGRLDLRLALAAPAPYDGWVSRWTPVAGVATHHREREPAGPGTPIVLLHGLAVSHRYLMPTARALTGRHRVLVPDLPGFGLSGKPAGAYDVGEHAEHVGAWLDALGLRGVAVLGHSFGAQVAVALARSRPAEVAALVLAGPTADAAARTRTGQVRRWLADLLREDPRQARILARDVRDAGPRRVFATLGHSVRDRIEEALAGLDVPVLVIGGGRDPVAPASWRARLSGPGAWRVAVPGAGHNVATTAGGPVADAISGFVAASSGPRGVRGEDAHR